MNKYVGLCPVKCLCQSVAKTFKFDISIFLEAVQLLKTIISYKSFYMKILSELYTFIPVFMA